MHFYWFFNVNLILIFLFLFKNRQEMSEFLQETIEDHRRTFDPSNLRDLLDTYLQEIQKATEEGTDRHLFDGRDHGTFKNLVIKVIIKKKEENCHCLLGLPIFLVPIRLQSQRLILFRVLSSLF